VPLPDPLVVAYLAAVALANLLVSRYGPAIAILNALLFIGLDLSARDHLHVRWQGQALWPRMLLLVGAGGLLSLLLGGSGRIAFGSCIAFVLAGMADSVVFRALHSYPWLQRVNGSNLAGAAVDSLCFPLIAFGWPVLWTIVLGQFVAKVAGAAAWSWLLTRRGQPAEDAAPYSGRPS
jgi:hypothetical protein